MFDKATYYKQRYKNNKTRFLEESRQWRLKNPNRIWETNIAYKFGITKQTYYDLEQKQDFKCAICKTDKPGKRNKRWCIDHDHQTSQIRGLLCVACNVMLGRIENNPNILSNVNEYLNYKR